MADLAVSTPTIDGFFRRWEASGAAERANYSVFLNELCDLLDVPRPDPAGPDDEKNAYVFESGSGRGHSLSGTKETWAGPIASSSHLPPAPAGVRSCANLPPPVAAFHPLPNFHRSDQVRSGRRDPLSLIIHRTRLFLRTRHRTCLALCKRGRTKCLGISTLMSTGFLQDFVDAFEPMRLGRFEKYYASVLIPTCMMGE